MHKNALENNIGKWEKTKHRTLVTPLAITSFFGSVKLYKKSHHVQMQFIQDLVLMIAKGYMSLSKGYYGKLLVKVDGAPFLWSNTISILETTYL